MKRKYFVFLVIILCSVLLVGCKTTKKDSKQVIVGKWAHGSYIYL